VGLQGRAGEPAGNHERDCEVRVPGVDCLTRAAALRGGAAVRARCLRDVSHPLIVATARRSKKRLADTKLAAAKSQQDAMRILQHQNGHIQQLQVARLTARLTRMAARASSQLSVALRRTSSHFAALRRHPPISFAASPPSPYPNHPFPTLPRPWIHRTSAANRVRAGEPAERRAGVPHPGHEHQPVAGPPARPHQRAAVVRPGRSGQHAWPQRLHARRRARQPRRLPQP